MGFTNNIPYLLCSVLDPSMARGNFIMVRLGTLPFLSLSVDHNNKCDEIFSKEWILDS